MSPFIYVFQATYWNTLYAANGTLVRGEFDPALIAVLAQQIATAPPGGSISIEASPGYPTIAQPLSAWSFYGAYQLFIGAQPGPCSGCCNLMIMTCQTWCLTRRMPRCAGSTWPRTGPEPGVDETNINWIKTATQAILPFTVGRYINRVPSAFPHMHSAGGTPSFMLYACSLSCRLLRHARRLWPDVSQILGVLYFVYMIYILHTIHI